jgi:CRP-like cAMP-binding protein
MLRKFIEQYTRVPDNEWLIINEAFERKIFAKNEIILKEGSICRYFYFLQTGLIRCYTFYDGTDITKYFTAAPYCFTSIESFRKQKPAEESIQTLEESVIWFANINKLEQLKMLNSWNDFTTKLLQEVQQYTRDSLLEIKTKTADQRYKELLNVKPEVLQRIPLKYLSGFLGVAPQSLSRIRKNITKKNN